MVPLWVRKFIVDFVETGLAAILVLNVAFPSSFDEASALGTTVVVALFAAAVSAFRRAVPGLLTWLRDKLNVDNADGT